MSRVITQEDIYMLNSHVKELYTKLELLEMTDSGYTTVDTIEGNLVSGSYTEDANSEIRRTLNFCLIVSDASYTVGELNRIWIDKVVRVYVGQKEMRTQTVHWYEKGLFVLDSADTSYSSEDNSITISCSDLVAMLDGTHGGIINAVTVEVPQGSIIRDVIIQTLTQLGGYNSYRVDDIGEYTCLEGICEDYEARRELYEDWNQVPYDLEFSTGCNVWEIISELRDLYPGFEAFFDEEGTFICQRIPNCEADDIVLDNSILNPLVISENTSVDLSTVRNVTQIYGHSIEVDRYSDTGLYVDGPDGESCWLAQLNSFTLADNIVVGVKLSSSNPEDMYLYICDNDNEEFFGPTPIVQRNVTTVITDSSGEVLVSTNIPNDTVVEVATTVSYDPIEAGTFEADGVYCFKYMQCLNTGEDEATYCWVYQGQYQVEAIYKNEDEDSPFCVQKLGERLQVLSGDEWDDITTDALAQENASYQTWLASRLTDTITLEMIDIPFLDTNTKVSYMPMNSDTAETYIVKNISENFMEGTMTVQMMKFYRLYPNYLGIAS